MSSASESIDENLNLNLTTSLGLISIFLCLFFVLILNKKDSNYARIVRHIVMSEGIYIFCLLGIVVRGEETYMYSIKKISRKIFHILTMDFLNKTSSNNNQAADQVKSCSIINLMEIFILAVYYSLEVFSLTLSIFICLELILILKNPIAQMKSRLKPYFILSSFFATIVFVMICTLDYNSIKPNMNIEEYMFLDFFSL